MVACAEVGKNRKGKKEEEGKNCVLTSLYQKEATRCQVPAMATAH